MGVMIILSYMLIILSFDDHDMLIKATTQGGLLIPLGLQGEGRVRVEQRVR